MSLTMFGAGSSVTVALHLPYCAQSVALAPGVNRAAKTGADGLTIIGSGPLDLPVLRMATPRNEDVKKPTLIGGEVAADSLREALLTSDGVIDSSSQLRKGIGSDDPLRLNANLRRRFMVQARDA